MTTEAIGIYSPTTVYGQLTYPFSPKKIHVNAHTPYDKTDESAKAVSNTSAVRKATEGTGVSSKIQTQKDFDDIKNLNTNQFLKTKTSGNEKDEEEDKQDFPPKSQVGTFTASSLSSYDIVSNSLKKGYSYKEALVISRASNAYKNSAMGTKNAVKSLSTRTYTVR